MSGRNHKYMVKRVNAAAQAQTRGVIKNGAIYVIIGAILLFAGSKIMRYALDNVHMPAFSVNMMVPFSSAKYIVMAHNTYMVYSSGRFELAKSDVDRSQLPLLTGVQVDENRPEMKRAFRDALSLDKQYLGMLSEVNISNPEKIVLLTISGKRIIAGDTINNRKMKNLKLALDKADELNKNFSSADIRFNDRVIIK
jgi:hypothetical protein